MAIINCNNFASIAHISEQMYLLHNSKMNTGGKQQSSGSLVLSLLSFFLFLPSPCLFCDDRTRWGFWGENMQTLWLGPHPAAASVAAPLLSSCLMLSTNTVSFALFLCVSVSEISIFVGTSKKEKDHCCEDTESFLGHCVWTVCECVLWFKNVVWRWD